MKKSVIAIFLALGMICTGCGNKDNVVTDLSKISGNNIEDGQQAGTVNDVEEYIEILNNEDRNTYSINVNPAGYKNAKIYEAKLNTIDDGYLKNMAAGIFDGGKYDVIKPYELSTTVELDAETEFFNKLESEVNDECRKIEISLREELERVIYKDEQDNAATKTEEGIIKTVVADFGGNDGFKLFGRNNDEFIGVECKKAKLRGKIDGTLYELDYRYLGGSATITLYNLTPQYRFFGALAIGDNMIDNSIINSTRLGDVENLCNEEQCRKQANDFLKKLKNEDFVETNIHKRLCGKDRAMSEIYMDGYTFIYSREVGGVNVPIGFNIGVVIDKEASEADSKSKKNTFNDNLDGVIENIVVEVGSIGVSKVTIKKYFEVGDCISDKNNLMTFEDVKDILANTNAFPDYAEEYKKQCEENGGEGVDDKYEQYAKMDKFVNLNMNFGYIPIGYNDSYAYIPAWIITCPFKFYAGHYNIPRYEFAINAIDGSIIHFSDDASVDDQQYGVIVASYLDECENAEE